ncbi:hypothetical protein Tco_0617834, partial [Tanacetum coccineum]
ESLPLLPKLLGAEPIGTLNDVIPLADLVQTFIAFDKTKQNVDSSTDELEYQ